MVDTSVQLSKKSFDKPSKSWSYEKWMKLSPVPRDKQASEVLTKNKGFPSKGGDRVSNFAVKYN